MDKPQKKESITQTMDAQKWAKEFIELFGHRPHEIDESLMIAWFANSIMTGHDIGIRKKEKWIVSELENIQEDIIHPEEAIDNLIKRIKGE